MYDTISEYMIVRRVTESCFVFHIDQRYASLLIKSIVFGDETNLFYLSDNRHTCVMCAGV